MTKNLVELYPNGKIYKEIYHEKNQICMIYYDENENIRNILYMSNENFID